MQTAAGVAAGALAFEGVEAVLHGIGGLGHPGFGFGGPGLGMGGFGPGMGMMGAGFERPVEETVVNNYYDQPGGQQHFDHRGQGLDQGGFDHSGQEPHFHESADQSSAHLQDASYFQDSGDQGSDTNANLDDTVLDGNLTQDGSIFDSGGGFDDGGGGFDGGGDDGGGFDGGGGDFS
jgi:hypothetical protein